MNIEVDTVKGFQDYLPEAALKREKIIEIAKKYYKLYGFLPLETPIVEFDELMKTNSLPSEEEDSAVSERFKLKDRGGRNLGLRYEFTFQLARLFRQNPTIKLPFKRYQIGPVFRDEPTRLGRTRQFTQLDIDIIGNSEIEADVECISVISDILKELKVKDITIEVNNRKLLDSIIESVQISNKKQVLRELDKIEKISEDQVKANLKKLTSSNQILTLFRLLEKPLSFFTKNAFDGAKDLQKLIDKCKELGIKTKFSPFMVRGFSYYTGNIFEVMKDKKAVIAGGRYDNSIGKFLNKQIPAVGISFSLEALMSICNPEIKTSPQSTCLLISIDQDPATAKLAKSLRKEEIPTITSNQGISKALDYANSQKIPYTIFIGESELSNKKFKLKNMQSGDEKEISEKALINFLKKKA